MQRFIGGAEDEVHDLGGGVDDSEGRSRAREPNSEEFLVEFDDDALLAFGVVDAGGAHSYGFVEALQALGFGV